MTCFTINIDFSVCTFGSVNVQEIHIQKLEKKENREREREKITCDYVRVPNVANC